MKIYLDNAATTKLHPKVLEKMLPCLNENYGNPSSIHSHGRIVKVAIEEAREQIAGLINADASEIYFVSGGTEADNFPIFGISKTNFNETGREQIITSKAEHHAVLESVDELNRYGYKTDIIDFNCSSDIHNLQTKIGPGTNLISLIHTNNETGYINDIANVSKSINEPDVYLHTDAVQTFGKFKLDVQELGVHALSASAHKIGGPKGIGFTYIKAQTPMQSLIYGGSQEKNRRGGTENVAGIIGFAEAAKIAYNNVEANYSHAASLRNRLIDGLRKIDVNGILFNSSQNQSPYILSLTFSNEFYRIDAESMMMYMDLNGISVSNGSACSSGSLKPSHVIIALGRTEADAKGTMRFSFSPDNTVEEIDYTLDVLKKMSAKFMKS
ncbi:MAG: cysteine desulfurase [Melioribacteraceae bacterium]|nr:cysteine desulfurase [Melioribacteraceae bacterium]